MGSSSSAPTVCAHACIHASPRAPPRAVSRGAPRGCEVRCCCRDRVKWVKQVTLSGRCSGPHRVWLAHAPQRRLAHARQLLVCQRVRRARQHDRSAHVLRDVLQRHEAGHEQRRPLHLHARVEVPVRNGENGACLSVERGVFCQLSGRACLSVERGDRCTHNPWRGEPPSVMSAASSHSPASGVNLWQRRRQHRVGGSRVVARAHARGRAHERVHPGVGAINRQEFTSHPASQPMAHKMDGSRRVPRRRTAAATAHEAGRWRWSPPPAPRSRARETGPSDAPPSGGRCSAPSAGTASSASTSIDRPLSDNTPRWRPEWGVHA
jgi:hypothetical protein